MRILDVQSYARWEYTESGTVLLVRVLEWARKKVLEVESRQCSHYDIALGIAGQLTVTCKATIHPPLCLHWWLSYFFAPFKQNNLSTLGTAQKTIYST